jgi:hypothetical protein
MNRLMGPAAKMFALASIHVPGTSGFQIFSRGTHEKIQAMKQAVKYNTVMQVSIVITHQIVRLDDPGGQKIRLSWMRMKYLAPAVAGAHNSSSILNIFNYLTMRISIIDVKPLTSNRYGILVA